jgi:hypothetical protein
VYGAPPSSFSIFLRAPSASRSVHAPAFPDTIGSAVQRTVGAAVAAAGLLLLGAGPADVMLCFHRDGRVAVEPYQERCCADDGAGCPEERPGGCPDDQCQDLPLAAALHAVQADPGALPAAPPSAELPAVEPTSPFLPPVLRASKPLSGDLDPPPLGLLRSVVLRQ